MDGLVDLDVTVTLKKRQVPEFVSFLETIERLGRMGATKTLTLWVDGDGGAQLRFDFNETDVSEAVPRWDDRERDLIFYLE